MSDTLLATKFYIPTRQANVVIRQRLMEKLDESIQHGDRLILISTPAGYGKTTLLGEWIHRSKYSAAWLSLDEGDNDPVKFMTYLIYALRKINPEIGETALSNLPSSQTQISNTQLTPLVNELAELPDKTLIILDDYHNINKQTIHNVVTTLIEHGPPHIHILLSSRADPPLPIARLRGRGQVTELRQNDLRFTLEEAAKFLAQNPAFDLSQSDIAALNARTEGWVAGLQMASASLEDQSDTSAFIQAFTGSNRFILDYLIEEVLENQSETIQNFLLHSSILEELCSPLCDSLISGFFDPPTSSQTILEELEHKNLFIIPLDDRRQWYRYHRLFSDLLRQRLELLHPNRKISLHQRASIWFESHEFPEAAIEHAFLAGDSHRAAELIERSAESILMQSQVTTILTWLKKLPPEELQTQPALSIYYAWALLWSGAPLKIIKAHMQLTAHQQAHSAQGLPLQAFLAIYNGDVEEAGALAQQAIDQLPEDDLLLRSLANFILASAHLARGETAKGIAILEETAMSSQRAGNVMIAALVLCELGDESQKHGHLHQAHRLYNQALEIAINEQGAQLPVAGKALIGLGDISREWNDLQSADELLTRGISLAEQWSVLGTFEGYINLILVKDAQGDTHEADELFSRLRELAYTFDASEIDDHVVEMFAARRNILHDDFDSVEEWIKIRSLDTAATSPISGEIEDILNSRLRKYENTILARFLIAKGQYAEALVVLDQVLEEAEKADRVYLIIDVEILRAIALQAQNKGEDALAAISNAMKLAEPEGFMRVFLDHGETLTGLLKNMRPSFNDPKLSAYSERLLNACSPQPDPGKPIQKAQMKQPIESLSDRELEVLHLLPSSLSSTEMANELSISVNTLRSHLKNIYSKLEAHSRYEAIARAKEAGLV